MDEGTGGIYVVRFSRNPRNNTLLLQSMRPSFSSRTLRTNPGSYILLRGGGGSCSGPHGGDEMRIPVGILETSLLGIQIPCITPRCVGSVLVRMCVGCRSSGLLLFSASRIFPGRDLLKRRHLRARLSLGAVNSNYLHQQQFLAPNWILKQQQ